MSTPRWSSEPRRPGKPLTPWAHKGCPPSRRCKRSTPAWPRTKSACTGTTAGRGMTCVPFNGQNKTPTSSCVASRPKMNRTASFSGGPSSGKAASAPVPLVRGCGGPGRSPASCVRGKCQKGMSGALLQVSSADDTCSYQLVWILRLYTRFLPL